ncbi:MAG: phosphoribosylaminoimidazolesuccinocarboxamide synthase [Nocardioidaceae bacterium]
MSDPLDIPGTTHLHSGKVRDLYSVDEPADPSGPAQLLMVASDRISAYDFALEPGIPDKGEILTRMSLWWFDRLGDIVPHHVLSPAADDPRWPEAIRRRAVLCERLDMFAVECVARGYLTGSGLADYARTGQVCGVHLPGGLVDGSRLDEPIFTPATKAALGEHDENVSYEAVAMTIGADDAEALRDLTLDVYARAEEVARDRGIILADTKLEFGRRPDDRIVLADEVLTPDSSRFWPADTWEPGRPQESYDKQFVRDWLTSEASGWDRASETPPPPLPEEIVARTRGRYVQAYERLTGERF